MPRIKAPLSEERREQIRRWLDPNVSLDAIYWELNDPRRFGLAQSTKDAIDWLLKNQTPEYFAAWLDRRSNAEREAIAQYLAGKK